MGADPEEEVYYIFQGNTRLPGPKNHPSIRSETRVGKPILYCFSGRGLEHFSSEVLQECLSSPKQKNQSTYCCFFVFTERSRERPHHLGNTEGRDRTGTFVGFTGEALALCCLHYTRVKMKEGTRGRERGAKVTLSFVPKYSALSRRCYVQRGGVLWFPL